MGQRGSAFEFLPFNSREEKPRTSGITEVRGPYYAAVGPTYFEDLFQAYGWAVDIFKFGAGSFTLMDASALSRFIDVAHGYDVRVSTGGFIEWVLVKAPHLIDQYLARVKEVGFDIVEVSSGYIAISNDDLVEITKRVTEHGLTVKPEINVQFGAGGGVATPEQLEAEGARDVSWAVDLAHRYLEMGIDLIMVESEGITENIRSWKTDVVAALVKQVGLRHLVFEAADPPVFSWYVKSFCPGVNLFIDHSQLVMLESLRSGTWGDSSLFGRVVATPHAHPRIELTNEGKHDAQHYVRRRRCRCRRGRHVRSRRRRRGRGAHDGRRTSG